MIISLCTEYFDIDGAFFIDATSNSQLQVTKNRIKHAINLDNTVSSETYGQSKVDTPYIIEWQPSKEEDKWFSNAGISHVSFYLSIPDAGVIRGMIESYRYDATTGNSKITFYGNKVLTNG